MNRSRARNVSIVDVFVEMAYTVRVLRLLPFEQIVLQVHGQRNLVRLENCRQRCETHQSIKNIEHKLSNTQTNTITR